VRGSKAEDATFSADDDLRGATNLIDGLSNAHAAEHFAAEREIICRLIGSTNQTETVPANFENRAQRFRDEA
jgi:hypothetical protein